MVVIKQRTPARRAPKRSTLASELEGLEAPRQEVSPRDQPFMLATLAEKPFSREGWLFEIKYDGIRVLASRRESQVELITGVHQDIGSCLR